MARLGEMYKLIGEHMGNYAKECAAKGLEVHSEEELALRNFHLDKVRAVASAYDIKHFKSHKIHWNKVEKELRDRKEAGTITEEEFEAEKQNNLTNKTNEINGVYTTDYMNEMIETGVMTDVISIGDADEDCTCYKCSAVIAKGSMCGEEEATKKIICCKCGNIPEELLKKS
jgi:hypothetical protein